MGESIAAAVCATRDANGWLILLADLPMIHAQAILAVAQAIARGAQAAYAACLGERGHPVGFSAAAGPALQNLKGNQGASGVLSAQSAIEIIVDDLGCVSDVHTLAQLELMRQRV